MPRFEYAAREESGQAVSGEIVANNRTEAAKILRAEGKFVVKIVEVEERKKVQSSAPIGNRRVKQDQVIFFANQLAVMVDTGVPLAEALQATIEDQPVGGFRTVVEKVILDIQGGTEFSKALAGHPKAFPNYFVNVVRASEASGLMGPMLHRIADYMTSQRDMKRRVIQAMAYPAAMTVLCFAIAFGLVTFLLPRFAKIFASRGAALPTPTQILVSTSAFVSANWYFILPTAALMLAALIYFWNTPTGYKTVSWLKINAPIIGPMYRKAYLSRAMRTMGTMIDAGVSMLETVDITRHVMENYYYEHVLDTVDYNLKRGNLLSDSLKGTDLFPSTLVQMVLAGERAGQMGPVMSRVADFCERDLNNAVKTTTQLIEPLLIVVMGSVIGAIVISLLLPIFTLSRVMSH